MIEESLVRISFHSQPPGQLVISFDLVTPGARLREPAAWGGDEGIRAIWISFGACYGEFFLSTELYQFAPDRFFRRWVFVCSFGRLRWPFQWPEHMIYHSASPRNTCMSCIEINLPTTEVSTRVVRVTHLVGEFAGVISWTHFVGETNGWDMFRWSFLQMEGQQVTRMAIAWVAIGQARKAYLNIIQFTNKQRHPCIRYWSKHVISCYMPRCSANHYRTCNWRNHLGCR